MRTGDFGAGEGFERLGGTDAPNLVGAAVRSYSLRVPQSYSHASCDFTTPIDKQSGPLGHFHPMSNTIYGYVTLHTPVASDEFISELSSTTPLGVFPLPSMELTRYRFPSDHLPPPVNSVVFGIADRKGGNVVSYLLDNDDYDPSADIGMPLNGKARIALLGDLIETLERQPDIKTICIALTVCNEIDETKNVPAGRLAATIMEDCRVESPPCKLYVMNK